MKKTPNLIILATFIASVFSACKNEKTQCPKIIPTGAPPYTTFEFLDSQGRDLLSKNTPGYFDTTYIKTANQKTIKIIPAGSILEYPGNKAHTRLGLWDLGTGTFNLKLSATTTDEIITKFTQADACAPLALTSLTYNGVAKQQTSKDFFIIVK